MRDFRCISRYWTLIFDVGRQGRETRFPCAQKHELLVHGTASSVLACLVRSDHNKRGPDGRICIRRLVARRPLPRACRDRTIS